MARMSPELRALIEQAWSARYREPTRLRDLGQAIAEAAPAQSTARAWGELHQALGARAQGQHAASDEALARAEAGFAEQEHVSGLRMCRALRALVLVPRGDAAQAEQLIGDLGDWPSGPAADVLQAHAAQFCLLARAQARQATGRWDDALRDRYAAVQQARATGDDGAIALALAELASSQANLSNADPAIPITTEALPHGERAGRTAAWQQAAYNRLAALQTLQRHGEAAAAADALWPSVESLHPRNRELALILIARAWLHAGRLDEAQTLLDRSVHERQVGMLAEWTVAQAEMHLARHDDTATRAARELCEAFLTAPASSHRAVSPDDAMLLHRAAATAHERLGDAASALRHARAEQALTLEVMGRAARARRVALEIEHQLSQERWQRAQAQARQQASEAEQARLDELNRALEAANQAKTRFLAAASHDLRQPVQALALNMAALELEAMTPPQAELVQRMGRSLNALAQMFEVLLDISRLDAGIVPVAPQPLALVPLLRRLHADTAAVAQARGLRVRLHLPPGAESATTQSDPVLLERCLRNLLDNALKYTRRGGVLLALRPAAAGWQLHVWDSGIGMTPEVQGRVFEEFYQADNAERDRARGLGLGLAIVRRVAGLLGHGLDLHSRAGHGTRVRLTVPRLAAATAAPAAPAHAVARPGQSLQVAVVDDDAEVRAGLVALLQRWGHAVLAAADTAELLRHWQAAGRPAVQAIVCDLRLRGGMSGVQAVAALRVGLGAEVPALVITGDVAPERLALLRASALPWLPKPVMPMRLRSWLSGLQG
jgi:signal transduction histidine kinase